MARRSRLPDVYQPLSSPLTLRDDRCRWPSFASAVALASVVICASPSFATEVRNEVGPASTAAVPQSSPLTEQESAASSRSIRYWTTALQGLMASAEGRDLLARLKLLIEEGDAPQTKRTLTAMMDMGTLAIIMLDHIQDPNLRASLQALEVSRQSPPEPVPPQSSTEISKSAELEKALASERERADAALRDLTAAKETIATLEANEAAGAQLKDAAIREKARADAALSELAFMREQNAALGKGAAESAELQSALRREKERSATLTQELERAKAQLATLGSVEANASGLRDAVEQEKRKAAVALDELELVRKQLAASSRDESEADGIRKAVEREKQRADAAVQKLNALQEQLDAMKANETRMQEALKKEKERAAVASQQLELALEQIAILKANTIDTAQDKDARKGKADGAPRKAQQAPAPQDTKTLRKPAAEAPAPLDRNRKVQAPSNDRKAAKPEPEPRNQSAAPVRETFAKAGRRPRVVVREIYERPAEESPLSLPTVLLPDNRLWRFY